MHPKFKFQNGARIWKCSLKQSCRVWKVEQLSFLEIFNFFRKFVSNLQNKRSGNSVNTSKIKTKPSATSLLAVGATQPLAADRFSPLSRAVTRCCLRGDLVRELSKPDASFSSINRSTTAIVFLSSRLLVASDLAALTKFILAESSRANCVC